MRTQASYSQSKAVKNEIEQQFDELRIRGQEFGVEKNELSQFVYCEMPNAQLFMRLGFNQRNNRPYVPESVKFELKKLQHGIDAVIALSVIYKGFDNVKGFPNYFGIKSPNLMLMVLVFGLIHGFGLSTRLQQLPLGDNNFDILMRIISFNVGVELGQIVALIAMLIVLNILRKSDAYERLSKVANHGLMLLGFMLLLMQLHGYIHVKNQEEFGFNSDEHAHIHMKMEEEKQNKYKHDSLLN